jgi:hypothetical protein
MADSVTGNVFSWMPNLHLCKLSDALREKKDEQKKTVLAQ